MGTTSYTAATSVAGSERVEVYKTNVDARMALAQGEIDALVVDLPTALSLAGEMRDGITGGQLPTPAEDVEHFGIVLDHGSALTRCVSWAVDSLRAEGELARLEQRWLAGAGRAPILR